MFRFQSNEFLSLTFCSLVCNGYEFHNRKIMNVNRSFECYNRLHRCWLSTATLGRYSPFSNEMKLTYARIQAKAIF